MTTTDPKTPVPNSTPALPIAAEVARAKYQRMRKVVEAIKPSRPEMAPDDARIRAFLNS